MRWPCPDPVMTAELVIEKIEGPLVAGIRRGARFMEIGLNHQAQFFAMEGTYDIVGKTIRHSLVDGKVHWDSSKAQYVPWIFPDANHHYVMTGDTTKLGIQFKTEDAPYLWGTDPEKFTYMGDQVDMMTIDFRHQLYFSARTREASINGSWDILTQRAKLKWRWHADGLVAAGTQKWDQLTGTGITVDTAFEEVTSGASVPAAEANINGLLSGIWYVI